jgi:hypothetical protein
MKSRTSLIVVAASALSLCVGAAGLPAASVAEPATHNNACFWGHDADNFTSPDDRTVYLRVGVRQVYELKLFSPCIDVDWSQRIALRSRGSDLICEDGGNAAEIITPSPIGRQRCQVDSVRKLSPAEVKALPKRYQP